MLSSPGSTEEQAKPLLLRAALSHLELAVANMTVQSCALQRNDSKTIQVCIEKLEELLSVEVPQRESSPRNMDIVTRQTSVTSATAAASLQRAQVQLAACEAAAPMTSESPSQVQAADSFAITNTRETTSTQNKKRKATLKTKSAPKTDIQRQDWLMRLGDIFDQIDRSNTGVIELKDWISAFEAVGMPSTQAAELLKAADTSNDGLIDRVEWMHLLENVQSGHCPKGIMEFITALGDAQAKNGRIYLKPRRPTYFMIWRPDSLSRVTWDLAMIALLAYIAIMLPFSIGFDIEGRAKYVANVTDRIVDALFVLDIFLNFRTGFYVGDVLVLDQGRIALHYMKTWFALDLLTCIPFEDLSAGMMPDLQPAKILKVGKIVKVFKLLRLGKLRAMLEESELFDRLDERMTNSFHATLLKLLMLLLCLLMACHWMACFAPVSGDKWAVTADDGDGGRTLRYNSAMYWAMMTLTTVGYGDVLPAGDSERTYVIASMVVGGLFYCFMVGKITSTISDRDLNVAAYQERMQLIHSWLHHHVELPATLRRRIKRFFQKHLTQKCAMDDIAIINDLSPALAHDVSFFLIQEEVRCNILFHNLPNGALQHIMPILEKTECAADEIIVSYGDPGVAMYIVSHGVAKYESGQQWEQVETIAQSQDTLSSKYSPISVRSVRTQCANHVLTVGNSFGEEIILQLEEEYHYTIVSTTAMSMFTISKEKFVEKFQRLPDIVHRMQENFVGHTLKEDDKLPTGKRGRASAVNGGLPDEFADVVLDTLDKIMRRVQKTERHVAELPRQLGAKDFRERELLELCIDRGKERKGAMQITL